MYLANQFLIGSTMHTPRVFEMLVDLAREGTVRPVIAETFPLQAIAQAQQQLARREHVGNLVVVPTTGVTAAPWMREPCWWR